MNGFAFPDKSGLWGKQPWHRFAWQCQSCGRFGSCLELSLNYQCLIKPSLSTVQHLAHYGLNKYCVTALDVNWISVDGLILYVQVNGLPRSNHSHVLGCNFIVQAFDFWSYFPSFWKKFNQSFWSRSKSSGLVVLTKTYPLILALSQKKTWKLITAKMKIHGQ